MKYPDFAKCKERSISMAKTLEQRGVKCKLPFGLFTPSQPKNLWDERWQLVTNTNPEFSHFWLEIEDSFFDCSLLQFGERAFVWSEKNDSRYQVLGYINLDGAITQEVGLWRIEWDSFSNVGGLPIMRMVPR